MIHCVLYKHWIVYIKLIAFILLMVGLPAVGYGMLQFEGEQVFGITENVKEWSTIVFLLYLNWMLLVGFIRWLEEEMDIIIVTNERIISIDQLSFFYRSVSETELSQVQDVKHIAKGVLSNLLNFGSLKMQTAGEQTLFVMKDVANGEARANQILSLCQEYKKNFQTQTKTAVAP